MSVEELQEQIGWEAEQYIPFDVNAVNIDFQVLEPDAGDGQVEVLLVAAKRDLVDDYVQVVSEATTRFTAVEEEPRGKDRWTRRPTTVFWKSR